MKNFLFLLTIVLSLFACKNKTKDEIAENKLHMDLCQVFEQIDKKDQKYRNLLADPFFEILDSIKRTEGITMQMHIDMPKEQQRALGSRARAIANKQKKEYTQEEQDSIWDLQIQLDHENTEQFLNIIDSLGGFPTKDNTQCDNVSGYILAHSQPEYHDKILEIIEKEKENGNEELIPYKLILYHVKGRDEEILFQKN